MSMQLIAGVMTDATCCETMMPFSGQVIDVLTLSSQKGANADNIVNPCPAMPGYIRGYGCFRSKNISPNFDRIVFSRCLVEPII